MKTIIEKRADQLQPGDIIVKRDGVRYAVQHIVIDQDAITIQAARIGIFGEMVVVVRHCSVEMDVEVDQLTPAQQHADELAEILREVRNDDGVMGFGINRGRRADELLAKLAPPARPTMEEMIRAMEQLAEGARHVADGTWDASTMQDMRNVANDIIRRARP